ncbi:MAG: hypothetical protein ACRDRX_15370 [Pseudonocardiaceae bacterium]
MTGFPCRSTWVRPSRATCGTAGPLPALDRSVFTRIKAPHRGLTSTGVTQVVAAAQRVGLGTIYAYRRLEAFGRVLYHVPGMPHQCRRVPRRPFRHESADDSGPGSTMVGSAPSGVAVVCRAWTR